MLFRMREIGKNCKHCQFGAVIEELTPDGPHYGKLVCTSCGRFNDWIPDPNKGNTKKRKGEHRKLVKKYSNGYCELCLTKEDDLHDNSPLIGHHVIPYVKTQDSSRANVWIICKACHSLIHWKRDYHGTNEGI